MSGASAMNDNGDKPAGWRKEWREPKPRAGDIPRSRARAEVAAALPSDPELRQRAVRVLLEIAEDPDAHQGSRVGAAARLVDLTSPDDKDEALSEATVDELLAAVQNALALKKGTP